jgi:hypothetical protein
MYKLARRLMFPQHASNELGRSKRESRQLMVEVLDIIGYNNLRVIAYK